MSSPHTGPDWPQQQPPHAPPPQRQSQPQGADAHADSPTEPIPSVSDAATQQWTMESPPDTDAPTQQLTMELPREQQAPPPGPPPEPPPGLPSGPPAEPPSQQPRSHEPPPPPSNTMRWIRVAAGVVILGALAVAAFLAVRANSGSTTGSEAAPPAAAAPTTAPVRGCQYPAQVLNLTAWNLTVPILGRVADGDEEDKEDAKKAKEVEQPDLATFADPPYFQVTSSCDSVAFRAPVNGITTSGSSYPRSELREMTPDGKTTASWSSSVGAHTFVVNEAFTALPQGKPNLVGVQIHDQDDDVSTFRLEGSNLYITEGDDTHHKLVTSSYVLGTRYEAKYIVSGDVIQAFYNGQLQTTITKKFSEAYFKAGAYTQANCDDPTVQCNSGTYGETTVYSVHVEHS